MARHQVSPYTVTERFVVCYTPSDSAFAGCASKGPSQTYLEANEVKYFSLGGGGGGVGNFMVTFSLFQQKLASCLCLPSYNEAKSRTEFHF